LSFFDCNTSIKPCFAGFLTKPSLCQLNYHVYNRGQLRYNLLYSKYTQGLFRVILKPDGLGVVPQSDPPLKIVDASDKGLGITQAPDGSIVEVRQPTGEIWIHQPDEPETASLIAKSCHPRRGGQAGGNKLTIYGVNLRKNGEPTVNVGPYSCPVTSSTSSKITCTLPGGIGTADVVVTSGADSYTFKRGYRYITGLPV